MTTFEADSPIAEHVQRAVADFWAGVTLDSAAFRNRCTIADIERALLLPEAREIEPTSEWDAADLIAADFRETPDLWQGIIPTGLTLLSAAPKVGKTRLLTQLSVHAVEGSPFIGARVNPTAVLTLALEDGARRQRAALRSRVGTSWGHRQRITVRTTSLRLDEGGIPAIEDHLDQAPQCRLVIVDVLARVRSRARGSDRYALDYDALAPLQRMASIRGIAVVVVHHANQRAEVSDTFERVSGTSGLTGVVDSLLLLQRRNADNVGVLTIAGREVLSQEICLGFEGGWWCPAPDGMTPEVLALSADVRDLWIWLSEHDGASTDELAEQYGRSKNTTVKLLSRLEDGDLVDSLGSPSKGRPVCWQVVRRHAL